MFYQLNRNQLSGTIAMENGWSCYKIYEGRPALPCIARLYFLSVQGLGWFRVCPRLLPVNLTESISFWLLLMLLINQQNNGKLFQNVLSDTYLGYLLVNPVLPPDIRSIFYYFFHRHNIGIFSAFSSLKLSPYLSACFYLSFWKMLGICSKCTTKYGNVRQCTTMYDNVPLYCHESDDHPSVPLVPAAKSLITKILCWNWWHVQSPSIKCLDLHVIQYK